MLLVPYSSTIEMIDWRIPVRIDATTIAVTTPTTMPSMVRNDRNLCVRIESTAITSTSFGNEADSFMLVDRESHKLALRQSNDRVEPRRFPCRVQSGDDPDAA